MQLTACGHGCHASHHLLGCLSPRSSAASPSLPSRPLLRRSVAPRSPPVLPAPRRSRPPSSLYPGSCRPSRLGEPRRSSSRPCAPPCLRAGAWSGPGPLSLSVSLCLTSRPCSPPWGRRPLGSEAPSSPRPRPPSQPPEPALCAPACPAPPGLGPACLPGPRPRAATLRAPRARPRPLRWRGAAAARPPRRRHGLAQLARPPGPGPLWRAHPRPRPGRCRWPARPPHHIQLPPLLLLLRRARASRAPGADTNSWRQRATSKRTEWPSCPAPFTTALSSMTRQPHAAALMYHMNVSGASGLPQAETHLLLLLFLFSLFVLHPRLTLGLLGCRARGRRARQRRRPGQRRRARSGGSLGLRPSRHLLPQQREHGGLAGPWRVAARSPSARRAWPAPSRPSSSRHAETGSLWIRLGHSGVWRVCLQAGVHDAPHWKGVGCGMGQVGGLSRT